MPHQEPSGPQGPSVRRAVPLPGSASRPDPSSLRRKGGAGSGPRPPGESAGPEKNIEPGEKNIEPGGPEGAPAPARGTAGADPESAAPEPAEAGAAETVVTAGATAPLASGPEGAEGTGTGAEAGAEAPEAGGEAAARNENAGETGTAGRSETAAPNGAEGAGAGAGVMAAASGGVPPEAATATDKKGEEPPTGRPTKSLLAAAAIGGVLLIAVPLLAFAANDDDDKEKAAPVAAGVTLPDKEEAKAPGLYRAKSPEPSKSEKKPKSEKKDADEKPNVAVKPGPPVTGEPATEKTAEPKDEKTGEAKEEKKDKKEAKPEIKKAVVPDASYTQNKGLRNNRTGMCADLPGYGNGKVGGEVNEFYCDTSANDNQLWNFDVKLKGGGPRGANLFVIRNSKDGLCMDLPGTGGVSGGGIIEGLCDGSTGDNQLWWLEGRGSGLYWIHNFASDNRCLEVWGPGGGGGYPNSRLSVTGCNPADDHEWRLG